MQNNFYALLYEIIDASPLHNTKARISTLMIKVDVRQPWFEIISYDIHSTPYTNEQIINKNPFELEQVIGLC